MEVDECLDCKAMHWRHPRELISSKIDCVLCYLRRTSVFMDESHLDVFLPVRIWIVNGYTLEILGASRSCLCCCFKLSFSGDK